MALELSFTLWSGVLGCIVPRFFFFFFGVQVLLCEIWGISISLSG